MLRTNGRGRPALGTAAMLYITHQTALPTSNSWQPYNALDGDIMVKGYGWEVWKGAVLRRGSPASQIVESTSSGYNTIQFNGEALLNFLSMQRVVLLGHAPPRELVREIKRRSTVGTQVGIYFINFESVSQAPDYNAALQPIADVQTSYLYDPGAPQAGVGAVACNYIDLYQNTTSPGQATICGVQEAGKAPHVWLTEVESPEFQGEWIAAVQNFLIERYGTDLDYALVDNVIAGLYYGDAAASQTNAGTRTQQTYTDGQKAVWALVNSVGHLGQGAKLIGNCGLYVPTIYSTTEVPRRYGEHYLHASQTSSNSTSEVWSTIAKQISESRNLKLMMPHCQIVGGGAGFTAGTYAASSVNSWVGRPDGPGGIYGTWKEMRDLAFGLGLQDVIVPVAGRGGVGNAFGLHWHEGWMDPR